MVMYWLYSVFANMCNLLVSFYGNHWYIVFILLRAHVCASGTLFVRELNVLDLIEIQSGMLDLEVHLRVTRIIKLTFGTTLGRQ